MTEAAAVPVWTTAARAASIFGIGERKIVALIQCGVVKGYQAKAEDDKRRPWMVDTRSLDGYHQSRAIEYQGEVERIAANVKRKLSR